MKKTLLITLASILCLSVGGLKAQDKIKVLDKSAKKVPSWVNSAQTDYIITSAVDKDLEAAKIKCLDNVRRYVIESVAENVKVSSESNISQTTLGNQIVSFLDEYKSTYQTQGADVPFLKGISFSKVEDYYWEKRRNKRTKEEYYVYSIRYPFPSLELKKMVHEFEERDREIWGRYLDLSDRLSNVTSLEQIDRAITDLGPVVEYLFDDTRKREANALRERYRKLYDNITFRTVWQTLGEYRFQLMLDGRPITTSQRLTLKSECATQLTSEIQGDMIVVRYNYDGCMWDEENAVTASVRIGGRAVAHKFYFTVKKYQVEIWPERTVYLTASEKSDSTLTAIGIRIFMKSGHYNPYTINTLTIEVPGISEPLFLDNLNATFNKGEAMLNVTWLGTVELLSKQNYRTNMLKGNMEVEVPEEELVKRIDFALPFKANW